MEPLVELLQLYSVHSTPAIEADGTLLLNHFHVRDPETLLAIEGYKEAFSLVSTCARLVDGLVERNPDPAAQARESVRLLRRMIDDGEFQKKVDATRVLIEGRLYRSWPAAHKILYDKKKAILEWRDFFVSYTNRDAPAINDQFRSLIRTCLGQAPRGNENQYNYVARVITRHLRRYQGLSGFFDEDNLKVGENIQAGVDRYCRQSFALVQLIEPLALEREPPRNWVFHEYRQFSENPDMIALMGAKDRHFFVLAGSELDALRPANLLPDYEPWVNRIKGLKYISLDNERNITLRAKIKVIATEILTLRTEIIDAWLRA
jgi:hypothetical protein